MKDLALYIKEELDDNMIWMLDQWFYNNDVEKNEFIDIITKCRKENSVNNIKIYIDNTNLLKNHIKEFVKFINDNISLTIEDDIYAFTNIIKQVIGNKSFNNTYIINEI